MRYQREELDDGFAFDEYVLVEKTDHTLWTHRLTAIAENDEDSDTTSFPYHEKHRHRIGAHKGEILQEKREKISDKDCQSKFEAIDNALLRWTCNRAFDVVKNAHNLWLQVWADIYEHDFNDLERRVLVMYSTNCGMELNTSNTLLSFTP